MSSSLALSPIRRRDRLDQREHDDGGDDQHAADDAEERRRAASCSMKPAAHPASLLPNAFDRNQTPIISPTMRAGDSLVTALRPTGLQAQLAELGDAVATTISHNGLTRMPPPACAIAPGGHEHQERQAHEQERRARTWSGTDGSRGPSRIHSHAKTGASRITKIGCTDWNHDEGNEKPKSSSRV